MNLMKNYQKVIIELKKKQVNAIQVIKIIEEIKNMIINLEMNLIYLALKIIKKNYHIGQYQNLK